VSLAVGAKLGPFEILGPLGTGGMGEVYRARDGKLGRDVAIKILPPIFASDPDRLTRFTREARLLASLNHPHIATIHGLEDADGAPAIVMELVEGPTLADRLSKPSRRSGQEGLPIDEALRIAGQIVDALETAHDRGIVHRDLKPANLKLTRDGQVKVLDFGLATALSDEGGHPDLSQRPTILASDLRDGRIVGTPAYMSPEQARGQPVDRRTDIWAFGCVLYEMITGRLTFAGDTISDTIVAILERSPDWNALPAETPTQVRQVLQRCLEKDPKRRWRDIADVRIALEDPGGPAQTVEAAKSTGSRGRERIAWVALAVLAALGAAAVAILLRPPPQLPEIRFDVSFPRGLQVDFAQLAISPDGQQLLAAPTFVGTSPLWLRPLGSTSGRTLAGTEGATFPFWSPDGKSIGFFAEGKLKRLDIDSQAVDILADAPIARGGAWQSDGTILFAPSAVGPLSRVAASGGQPSIVTHLEEGQNDHRAPFLLPDGRHFLYYSRGTPQVRGVWVALLDGSEPRRLLDADAAAVYASSGHLLFVRNGELLAQPFDASRLTLEGEAFRMASGISVNPGVSLASLSASPAGPIAYGTGSIRRTQFAWFDRSGRRLESIGTADQTNLANPSLSPDGQRIAFSRVVGNNWDIWLVDMQGTLSRLTTSLALDFNPLWSRDGRQVFFQGGNSNIVARTVDDSAPEQLILRHRTMVYPSDISPDGRTLLVTTASGTSVDLAYLSLTGDRTLHSFINTPFHERDGQFSGDGRWVAYQSNITGRNEIFLQPFPGPGQRIQVSSGGGQQPRWGPRGSELYYVAADQRLTTVPVTFNPNGGAAMGQPMPLFRIEFENNFLARQQYAVSSDGRRILANAATEAMDPPWTTVILNWKARP
jgi:serine/threonine protein kinase/Tol biopolymer transport system component